MRKSKREEYVPSKDDVFSAQALESATTAAISRLKDFHAVRPDYLPKGLPRSVMALIVGDAIGAWIRERINQARQQGAAPDWWDSFVECKAWPPTED